MRVDHHNVNGLLELAPPGAALLCANGPRGWQPQCLALLAPVRFIEVAAPEPGRPLAAVTRALAEAAAAMPPVPQLPGHPRLPLAVVAVPYEFGAAHVPLHAVPACFHPTAPLVAAIHTGYWYRDGDGALTPHGQIAALDLTGGTPPRPSPEPLRPLVGTDRYREAIAEIHRLIAAGDCYQVNYTVPFEGRTTRGLAELLDRAEAAGGAPYLGALRLAGGGALLSLSPELYLRRRGAHIETRPIKGTRSPAAGAAGELLASAKERAEHIMIVDMERNDLGRLCEAGSVAVRPMMEAVAHPTVVHLESTVAGRLRAGVTPDEIFAATFPGGSVTGAPRRRVLEAIRALEPEPRGYYCGAFGWIDAGGDMELNLPIRTAALSGDGRYRYHAGGGITIDSDAAAEWQELLAKTALWWRVAHDPNPLFPLSTPALRS